jgi:hypothetical protein
MLKKEIWKYEIKFMHVAGVPELSPDASGHGVGKHKRKTPVDTKKCSTRSSTRHDLFKIEKAMSNQQCLYMNCEIPWDSMIFTARR